MSRSRFHRPLALLAPLLAVLLSGCITTDDIEQATRPITDPARRDAYSANASSLERSLHHRIDQYRASLGLSPLAFNSTMAELAREHAVDMARRDRLDHKGYNNRVSRLRQGGLTASENVAYTKGEPDVTRAMLRFWIESPPHQRNMSKAGDTTCGVGFAQAENGAWYAAALFGH